MPHPTRRTLRKPPRAEPLQPDRPTRGDAVEPAEPAQGGDDDEEARRRRHEQTDAALDNVREGYR